MPKTKNFPEKLLVPILPITKQTLNTFFNNLIKWGEP